MTNRRCILCDYVEGHGNSYITTPQGWNKIRWDEKSAGYICYDCDKHTPFPILNKSFNVTPFIQACKEQTPLPAT